MHPRWCRVSIRRVWPWMSPSRGPPSCWPMARKACASSISPTRPCPRWSERCPPRDPRWRSASLGSTAWVLDGFEGVLAVNMANPAAPTVLGRSEILPNRRALALLGQNVLLLDEQARLVVVNGATPSNPRCWPDSNCPPPQPPSRPPVPRPTRVPAPPVSSCSIWPTPPPPP